MNWQETDYWKENHPPVEVETTTGNWWIDQEGVVFQAGEFDTDLYNIGCDGPFASKEAAESALKKGVDYGFLR